MGLISAQNNISVAKWRLLKRWDDGVVTGISFDIDDLSMAEIRRRNLLLDYGYGQD